MEKVILKAARRSVTGKHVKTLRQKGLLPCVMYGNNVAPINITLDAHSASRTLGTLSSSTIVVIDVEGEQHSALVREKQKNYMKNTLLHVDFQIISLTETLRTAVSIVLTGESVAVNDLNAVLVHSLSEVEVEALPGDLPEHLTVDISKLENIGDSIYVRDLTAPSRVTILTDGDEVIVVATAAAREEEPEATADTTEPEVIERGKKDEDED